MRGAHGHEKSGYEVLRVMCSNCQDRVVLEPNQNEAKCPKCGKMVKRPKSSIAKSD